MSDVLKHVDEFAKRVADIKPAHAPRLIRRPINNRYVQLACPRQRLLKIIHFYGKIWNLRARTAFAGRTDLNLHLCRRCIGLNPAMIHGQFQAKQIAIKKLGSFQILTRDIDHNALYFQR